MIYYVPWAFFLNTSFSSFFCFILEREVFFQRLGEDWTYDNLASVQISLQHLTCWSLLWQIPLGASITGDGPLKPFFVNLCWLLSTLILLNNSFSQSFLLGHTPFLCYTFYFNNFICDDGFDFKNKQYNVNLSFCYYSLLLKISNVRDICFHLSKNNTINVCFPMTSLQAASFPSVWLQLW